VIRVRPAAAADLAAIATILAADDEPVDWPDAPGWPYLEHLLTRASVPVAVDGADVLGFAGAIDLDGPRPARFLTDLFVDPRRQAGGASRALLEVALDDSDERMTFSSADPRALALYIRAGMRPWWPLLYLSGSIRTADRGDGPDTAEPITVGEAARWSSAWTGIDRAADFAYYASLPGAAGFAVREAGAVAAVGWARRQRTGDGRWLEHLLIAPDADPVQAVIGAWRAAAGGGGLTACVAGPHPAVAVLLADGIRITDRDQWCASDPDLIDPIRLLPNPGFL